MENLKIIVCCHKQDLYKDSNVYMPLHVGKALSNTDLGIHGDNSGDNISIKNDSYCELTGMYWAWKNLKGVDYIGLCHYRRYFDFNHIGRKHFPLSTIKTECFSELNLDISQKAEKWLEKGGCILAKANHQHASLFTHYCEGHYSEDIKIVGDIIRDTLPRKYFKAFIDILIRSNRFSPYNMFVMNWRTFDNYCTWLFNLLEKAEEQIDITHYSTYQKRVFGYLAERLLNLYVHAEKLRVMQIPVLKISDEAETDDIPFVKYMIRSLLRDFAIKVTAEIPK